MTRHGWRRGPETDTEPGLRHALEARAALEEAVRAYFRDEGFVEVTTPVALPSPNLDPNVRPVPVTIRDFNGRPSHFWLHTSPELSMKKLVARGAGSIFQIARVFRDGEMTRLHSHEFSMLEWYRVQADYEDAIRDTIRVIRAACSSVTGSGMVTFAGTQYDLAGPWEELTMAEAFQRHAGVGSWDRESLALALEDLGHRPEAGSSRQDLFFRLYVEAVEPHLGVDRPTIIRDYPEFLGTMAKPREDDEQILERFEVYIGGLELANGFTELSDAGQLRERMEAVIGELHDEGVRGLSVDEEFLDAMEDLPPCAGVSVGMDRLAMIAMDVQDIAE
ncbi:MAG: EF-P lysine aminoacylase GenX, partial [bacterium]